ncbi:hypothetical protein [Streptomyces californicus]|uniref:hypothetical protein n=1 Tax=Streptomyces californicus TaxID=67351 RepID=UPI00369743A1
MTADPATGASTITQPYNPGYVWRFTSKSNHTAPVEYLEKLALRFEVAQADLSDGYQPVDITPEALWAAWADTVANTYHQQHPDQFRPGEVPIYWTVDCPGKGMIEPPPHLPGYTEDFLTYYTHPVHAVTDERLNWLRLPVLDSQWNETITDRGGFIQQVTGWKPSPLQPTMDVRQIGAAAGLYVPPL